MYRNDQYEFVDSDEEGIPDIGPISLDGPMHGTSEMDTPTWLSTYIPTEGMCMYTITLRPSYYERTVGAQLEVLHDHMKVVDSNYSDSIILCRYERTKRGNVHAHALISASKMHHKAIIRYCRREIGLTYVKDVFDFDGAYSYLMKESDMPVEISGQLVEAYRKRLKH